RSSHCHRAGRLAARRGRCCGSRGTRTAPARSRPPASATWTSPWLGCTGWTRATWRRWRGSIGGSGGIPIKRRVRVGETLPPHPTTREAAPHPPAARVGELRGELRVGAFAGRQPLRRLLPPPCPGAGGDERGRRLAAVRGRTAAARRAVVTVAPRGDRRAARLGAGGLLRGRAHAPGGDRPGRIGAG